MKKEVKLQVLVSTYKEEGIERMSRHSYPEVEGVEYIVAWQLPEGDAELPASLVREDVRIVKSRTRGLSANRNIALEAATAPLLLIADDDLDYTEAGLKGVIESFAEFPECDILTFRYESELAKKRYAPEMFNWRKPPRNSHLTSFEIGMRRESIARHGLRFDERFGIGGLFIAGEENVFFEDALRAGLQACFIPHTICAHWGTTTTERHLHSREFIRTKGGTLAYIHPATWPLRLMTHLYRNHRDKTEGRLSTLDYFLSWLRGALDYYLSVFRQ